MRIVLATDGSESAAAAARFLSRWPLGGARVDVLSVAEWSAQPVTPDEDELPDVDVSAAMEAEMARAMEDAVALLSPHCKQTGALCRRGDPATEIIAYAAEVDADLVVLGSHGRRGVSRFLLGSVSHSTATSAGCSVLVVRDTGGSGPIDVLLGRDASDSALAAVSRLAALGKRALGRVRIVTVMLLVTLYRQDILQRLSPTFQRRRAAAAKRLAESARRVREAGVAADVEEHLIDADDAASSLIDQAEEMGADLVMVGESDARDLGRIVLGSVAARVLSHAQVSVWIEKNRTPR